MEETKLNAQPMTNDDIQKKQLELEEKEKALEAKEKKLNNLESKILNSKYNLYSRINVSLKTMDTIILVLVIAIIIALIAAFFI